MLNNLTSVNQRKSHQNDRSSGSVDPNTGASNLSKNANNNEDSAILKPLSDVSQDSQTRSQLQSRSQDEQRKFGIADDSLHFRDTFKQSVTNSTSMSVTSKNITTASYLNQNNQFITSQPIPTQKLFGADTQTNNDHEPKTGIEELERRLNELESSASKANMTILQTMFTAAKPEPAFRSGTPTKQQSPNKITTKASPQKSQNNSEISVEKPVSENPNALSKNNSQQQQSDSDTFHQQSENNNSQRENKKKAKRQEKKRNNNANNDELQPTLEDESHHNQSQSQDNKVEQEVEVTFEVLKQTSSDEATLADQLQASSASFNQSLTQKDRPQDSHYEESGDFTRNQPTSGSNEKHRTSNFDPSVYASQEDQHYENENYQLNQGKAAEKNRRAQKPLNNEESSQQNSEVEEASRQHHGLGQNKKGSNTRKVENSGDEDIIQDSAQESEYFQGSNIGTQKSVQNKKKSQKSKKNQKQQHHEEQEEHEGEEASSYSHREQEQYSQEQQSRGQHQKSREEQNSTTQEQQSRGQHQKSREEQNSATAAAAQYSQDQQYINSEGDREDSGAHSHRQRENESPLSYENASRHSQNIHHNPFYPNNTSPQGLEKQPSKKHNFNLDISQGQSQNSQSQEASSHQYNPHQVPQKKYENSPVKNTKPYLVNNHPSSQNHEEDHSLENNDKEEISQVLSVYSKRENNQTRNELNDSHHQGSDRGGANQSQPKFSQENVNNFKHSFEKLGKQETPTHFEIGKSELSELRLSRMSEEQAASLYEQRKNDIQKSIQKISKNKKKVVQSTPKNQGGQHPTSSQPIQHIQQQHVQQHAQIPVTRKKVNPSAEIQSNLHHKEVSTPISHQEAPVRERTIKKSKPQPRNQLSPKPEQTNPTPTTAATVMTEEKVEKTQPKKKVSELKLKATVHVNPNANVNVNNASSHRQKDAQVVVDKDPIQVARESILQRMENIEKALVKTDGSEERGAPVSKKPEQQQQQLRSTANKKANPRTSESNEARYGSQTQQNPKANNNSYSSKFNTPTPMVTDPGYEHTTENSNAPTPLKQGGGSSYSQLQRANKLRQSTTSEYSQEDERLSRKGTDSKVKVETLNLRSTINKRNTNGGNSSQAASHRQYTAAPTNATTTAENTIINNNTKSRSRIAVAEKEIPKAKGPQVNYSEIPQNSKYNPLSPQKSLDVTQEKQTLSRENSLNAKRSTGGFQSRLNSSKNSANLAKQLNKNNQIQNQGKNQRAVSASPDYMDNNYSRFYNIETSFEERNRLWVIKKNQNLAANERKQYAEEKSVCTFSPFSGRSSSLSGFDPANFYHKNQEWVEKVKTETLTKGDLEIQKRHNPEPRKPRQKVAPLTAIDAIRSQKLFVTRNLEALKNDIDYKDPSNNKGLKTYLEYDWEHLNFSLSNTRLRDEIGEIEELYSYVKGLVKKRLDKNTGEPVESNQNSINAGHPRGRDSSYPYKHKSPNARAASLNNSIDNIRVQTLKKTVNKKEALSSLNSVDRERPHNDKLETSVHSESNLRDLMKNKESKKLTIRDNHYVIVDSRNSNNNSPQVL